MMNKLTTHLSHSVEIQIQKRFLRNDRVVNGNLVSKIGKRPIINDTNTMVTNEMFSDPDAEIHNPVLKPALMTEPFFLLPPILRHLQYFSAH